MNELRGTCCRLVFGCFPENEKDVLRGEQHSLSSVGTKEDRSEALPSTSQDDSLPTLHGLNDHEE